MKIETQRRNDKCVMENVLQSNLSTSKRIQVKACRLYVRVVYLSDIIEPDSRTADITFYSGKRPA